MLPSQKAWFLLIILLGLVAFFYLDVPRKLEFKFNRPQPSAVDSRQPQQIKTQGGVKVKYPQDYTIVLLGDSMTERLGNSDELLGYLKKYYPDKSFQFLNYGFGATNILSIQDRLERDTFHGRTFMPILNIAFDIILIESFGHNPLSQFALEEGLKKQTEALDKAVKTIKEISPAAKIIFVATIAPNKLKYGERQVELDPSTRAKWAEERMSYIENHINFAKTHGIPLINIYQKSLNGDQGGNLDYINTDDYIHPSPTGIYFISEQIAKYIFENKLLP